jgi:hypothetical protein
MVAYNILIIQWFVLFLNAKAGMGLTSADGNPTSRVELATF